MVCDELEKCSMEDEYSCHHKKVNCLEYRDSRKICVCEEKKMKYQLENDIGAIISKYHIDGGVVSKDSEIDRCDFLIVSQNCAKKIKQVFVELKGKDVIHAMEQLKSSVTRFQIKGNGNPQIRAVCVCKKVPDIQNDARGNALRKYFIANHIQFEKKSGKFEEKLSKIW